MERQIRVSHPRMSSLTPQALSGCLAGNWRLRPPFLSAGFRGATIVCWILLAVPRRHAGGGGRALVRGWRNGAASGRDAGEMDAL